MPTPPAPPHRPSLAATRRIVFALALASFVLSFFHRTAPAAIAGELTQAFSISAAVLGTLAATYFYVYTLLQIPVGVLADTLGPRKLLAGGSAIAALGSLLFALAPAWELAAVGRTLVGIGVSVAFISILKVSRRLVPGQSLRHARRHDDVRRQPRRGDRRRAAGLARHAGLVALGVRRRSRCCRRCSRSSAGGACATVRRTSACRP